MSLSCLDTLVGIAPENCACYTAGWSTTYANSSTGYFATDREYGYPVLDELFNSKNCMESDVWELLVQCRADAIRDFKTDMASALANLRRSKIIQWNGTIGNAQGTALSQSVNQYVGAQLTPNQRMKGGSFVITGIWFGGNITGTINLESTSTDPGYTPVTIPLTATANKFTKTTLGTPLVLPMYVSGIGDLYYNFKYNPTGMRFFQNSYRGCCGNANPAWMVHMNAGGFGTSNFLDTNRYLGSNTDFNGLAFEGYFTCASLDWICELENLAQYQIKNVVGRAIQAKTTVKAISATIETSRINQHTILAKDEAAGRRVMMEESYNQKILWLAQNLPDNASDCWDCTKNSPHVAAIIV
jgi:hypothetical protein